MKRIWTLERCKAEALKFSNTTEWIKISCSSYVAAFKNNWLKQCCFHMKPDDKSSIEKEKKEFKSK